VFPYELRIGVTGHRTATGAVLEAAVSKVLDRISAVLAVPVAPLTWVIVSPLAHGADRLVARVAMERGARLEVIIPFPMDEYVKDFAEPRDRAEFEELRSKARSIREPTMRATQSSRPGGGDADYLRAGEQVVDACEILIAVWDGRGESGRGGTAEIVRYAVETGRVVLWVNSELPQLAPAWIRSVPEPVSDSTVLAVHRSYFPKSIAELSPSYYEQVEYCSDSAIDSVLFKKHLDVITNKLEKASAAALLSVSLWQTALAPLVREYARADLLALLYGRRHAFIVHTVLSVAAAGVTAAVAQVLFFQHDLWIVLFEVLAMLAVLLMWWYNHRAAWRDKWLRNRYLAERFRAAIFTTLANSARDLESDSPERDELLPFYGAPQHWLTLAASNMSLVAARGVTSPELAPLKEFIASAWISEQYAFHAENAAFKADMAHSRRRLGMILFAATLLMASLHLVKFGHGLGKELPHLLHPELWITFLALVLPVWAGAIDAITVHLDIERIAERSRRMAQCLVQIRQRVLRSPTREELRRVTEEAAELIRVETHEWWVLFSFQDIRLHA
jgi:hypothetical protein